MIADGQAACMSTLRKAFGYSGNSGSLRRDLWSAVRFLLTGHSPYALRSADHRLPVLILCAEGRRPHGFPPRFPDAERSALHRGRRGGSGRADTARLVAVAEALFAATIWASSFVGVKVALEHAGPLTVGGLRYFAAFLLFLPLLGRASPALAKGAWVRLTAIGIAQYTVGNAALFWALGRLPATAGSLSLALVPIMVVLFQVLWLRERPGGLALCGVALTVGGAVVFFSRDAGAGQATALAALGLAVVAFAVLPVLGRELARDQTVSTVPLTAIPLGIGGGVLLSLALVWEGVPRLPLSTWGVVAGLALVNTALAYLLFNHALQHLTATEANVILNLSPFGTAILAWYTLGERLTGWQIVAMATVLVGVVLVQVRRREGVP